MSKERNQVVFRAYLIYFGFVLIMLLVLYQTVMLQFYSKKSSVNPLDATIPVRTVPRVPRMGDILDANLLPLLTSVSYFDIHMDPTVVKQKLFDTDVNGLAEGLAKLYPTKSAREWENAIRSGRANGSRYLLIRKKATNAERKALRKLPIFKEGRMKGGIIDNEDTILRKKPNGNLLNRTLGYYKVVDGKVLNPGIEGAYIDYLRGETGAEVEQKISICWKKTGKILKEAVEGADVVSTIEKEIQEVAHSELNRQLIEMNAQSGSVIVMEVNTGYVRAIVNLSREKDGSFAENYNHAFGSIEAPGSTFKLASLMAALEDGKVKITDTVNAVGVYSFYGYKLSDSNHGRGYGIITLQEAFEKSSNVIAQVINTIYRKEPNLFMDRMDDFGLTKKLGIDLVGEAAPDFSRPGDSKWSPLSIPWMSIGYGIRQSPLQTLAFYNAVANNGKLLRPIFVQEIRRRGNVIKEFLPVVLNEKICSQETINILKSCLEGVMSKGTGSSLTSSQFKIAGKTGTTKLPGKDKQYLDESNSVYQASFVGYFPADKPKYSCIVVITDPKKEYYGARVSGTVFAEIANKVWASSLEYHPAINQNKLIVNDLPSVKKGNKKDLIQSLKTLGINFNVNFSSDWFVADTLNNKVNLKPFAIIKESIPNVIGLTAKDAVYLLESMGMVVRISGYGVVKTQSIQPGSIIFKGGLIQLQLK